MGKIISILVGLTLIACTRSTSEKTLEIKGKKLVSQKPLFTLALPSEFQLIHFSSLEYPKENSLTRAYFFIKEKNKTVEEMFIVQIADRTNPQAEPIAAPPLKPITEKTVYSKGKIKRGVVELDHLIQLFVWNPDAPSLQPIVAKGITIPSRWALQGQLLFTYQGEHAVHIRYSKDINSFGLKVSEEGKGWEIGKISGNEKKVYETFQKTFMEMMNSIDLKNP